MSFFGGGVTNQPIFGAQQTTPMFGSTGTMNTLSSNHNVMKDGEVVSPPDDSISALAFSPVLQQNYLVAGSWDNQIRCWEITGSTGAASTTTFQSIPRAQQTHQGPVLDVAWTDVSR